MAGGVCDGTTARFWGVRGGSGGRRHRQLACAGAPARSQGFPGGCGGARADAASLRAFTPVGRKPRRGTHIVAVVTMLCRHGEDATQRQPREAGEGAPGQRHVVGAHQALQLADQHAGLDSDLQGSRQQQGASHQLPRTTCQEACRGCRQRVGARGAAAVSHLAPSFPAAAERSKGQQAQAVRLPMGAQEPSQQPCLVDFGVRGHRLVQAPQVHEVGAGGVACWAGEGCRVVLPAVAGASQHFRAGCCQPAGHPGCRQAWRSNSTSVADCSRITSPSTAATCMQ